MGNSVPCTPARLAQLAVALTNSSDPASPIPSALLALSAHCTVSATFELILTARLSTPEAGLTATVSYAGTALPGTPRNLTVRFGPISAGHSLVTAWVGHDEATASATPIRLTAGAPLHANVLARDALDNSIPCTDTIAELVAAAAVPVAEGEGASGVPPEMETLARPAPVTVVGTVTCAPPSDAAEGWMVVSWVFTVSGRYRMAVALAETGETFAIVPLASEVLVEASLSRHGPFEN